MGGAVSWRLAALLPPLLTLLATPVLLAMKVGTLPILQEPGVAGVPPEETETRPGGAAVVQGRSRTSVSTYRPNMVLPQI